MKRFALFAIASLAFAQSVAFAQPADTDHPAYQDDKLGTKVYHDDQDAGVFWYTPLMKMYSEDGKSVKYLHRTDAKSGKTLYTFFIVPYMPEDVRHMLMREVGAGQETEFKPIIAKKVAIQMKSYNVIAASDIGGAEATDYQYLNQPQTLRFELQSNDAQDFNDLFTTSPGVQINFAIYFEAQTTPKSLKFDLTCKQVYDAMSIGLQGRYTFTAAEISRNMGTYLANNSFNIVSKGGLTIPTVVESAIQNCFKQVQPVGAHPVTPANGGCDAYGNCNGGGMGGIGGGLGGYGGYPGYGGGYYGSPYYALDRVEQALASPGTIGIGTGNGNGTGIGTGNDPGNGTFPNNPFPTGGLPNNGNGGCDPTWNNCGTGGIGGDQPNCGEQPWAPGCGNGDPNNPIGNLAPNLTFIFRKDTVDSNVTMHFDQKDVEDSESIDVFSAYLREDLVNRAVKVVKSLPRHIVNVTYDSTSGQPSRSHIIVKPGDQYTISAAFDLFVKPYGRGDAKENYWQAGWTSPKGDLYYRVGDDAWKKVNDRAIITSDRFESGELEFYLDRAAIYDKVPANLKKKSVGIFAPLLPYASFYPDFSVTITGRHYESD